MLEALPQQARRRFRIFGVHQSFPKFFVAEQVAAESAAESAEEKREFFHMCEGEEEEIIVRNCIAGCNEKVLQVEESEDAEESDDSEETEERQSSESSDSSVSSESSKVLPHRRQLILIQNFRERMIRSFPHPLHRPKLLQQIFLGFGADARNRIQCRCNRALLATTLAVFVRKAMGLVAQTHQEKFSRSVFGECDRIRLPRNEDLLFLFCKADGRNGDFQSTKNFHGRAELSFATIDDNQIRRSLKGRICLLSTLLSVIEISMERLIAQNFWQFIEPVACEEKPMERQNILRMRSTAEDVEFVFPQFFLDQIEGLMEQFAIFREEFQRCNQHLLSFLTP